jgi:Transposase DDE domain
MAATPRETISRSWPRGRSIFLGSMRWENVPSGATAPNRLPPSAFLYPPERNRYVCPEGKVLHPRPGLIYYRYEATAEDCQGCPRKPECCPENEKCGRSVARPEESLVVIAFRRKMASKEAQAQYCLRGRIVEFCHAWIKSKPGLRQFHLRGLRKVQVEMLWACLTYNMQHWIRLRKPVIAAEP